MRVLEVEVYDTVDRRRDRVPLADWILAHHNLLKEVRVLVRAGRLHDAPLLNGKADDFVKVVLYLRLAHLLAARLLADVEKAEELTEGPLALEWPQATGHL